MRACIRLDDGACSEWFLVNHGLRQGCVLSPLLFNIFFTAVLDVAMSRCMNDARARDSMVTIRSRFDTSPLCNKSRQGKTRADRDAIVRNLLRCMLYADDAGIVSRSAEGLSAMMSHIVITCQEFGLVVSETKTETMRMREVDTEELRVQAAGQSYPQCVNFTYLGGCINDKADITAEIRRRRQRAAAKMRKYSKPVFDRKARIARRTKLSLVETEVVATLLYGCETWTLSDTHYRMLRQSHHHYLLRCVGFKKRARTDHLLSYHELLRNTKVESIESMIRRRRLQWAGKLVRMPNERLPKMMLFGELEHGKRRRGAPPNNWRRCLKDDLNKFKIDTNKWIELASDEKQWQELLEKSSTEFFAQWLADKQEERRLRHAKAAII